MFGFLYRAQTFASQETFWAAFGVLSVVMIGLAIVLRKPWLKTPRWWMLGYLAHNWIFFTALSVLIVGSVTIAMSKLD
jgi:hypothetical protein